MGITAAITSAAALASTASTVSGMINSGGDPTGMINSAVGSGISAASQLEAGNIQKDAAQKAIEQQTTTGSQVTGQYNPFLDMNQGVTTGLKNLLGVGVGGAAGMLSQLQQTPGYQFALQQGNQQVLSQLSAMGLAKSGSALKGVANYTEGLASQTYQNMVSNFLNGGTLSLNATNSFANAAFGNQSAINALTLNRGAAEASGLVGAANVLNAGLNNLNALNPNTYGAGGTPGGGGTMPTAQNPFSGQIDRLSADGNAYTTNQIAMQNPYQIQAPQIAPAAINPSDPAFAIPSLPT